MATDGYAQVTLGAARPFHEEPMIKTSMEGVIGALKAHATSKRVGSAREMLRMDRRSPLLEWLKRTGGPSAKIQTVEGDDLDGPGESFPLYGKMDEIVASLMENDVVLLLAPTGTGKSVLAPLEADRLARSLQHAQRKRCYFTRNVWMEYLREHLSPDARSMLVSPNAEHCGATARCFRKFFSKSGIRIACAFTPYKFKMMGSGDSETPNFVFSTYNTAMDALRHAEDLTLLVLDEVHDCNDNIQTTIAVAMKMMLAEALAGDDDDDDDGGGGRAPKRTLQRLLLTTATLSPENVDKFREHFERAGLKFGVVDYLDTLERNKKLTMTHIFGSSSGEPSAFTTSALGESVFVEMFRKGIANKQDVFGDAWFAVEDATTPDLQAVYDRMVPAVDGCMADATRDLTKRLDGGGGGDYNMRGIIVILPSVEHVDRMYSEVTKLKNYKFHAQRAFQNLRLTSDVKDDPKITVERENKVDWRGDGLAGSMGIMPISTKLDGLTVPGGAHVVDSGLQRVLDAYTKDGLRGLTTHWIDKQMIIQRAGRTGRTHDGTYLLPYSVLKANAMMKETGLRELMLLRSFDEHHLYMMFAYDLKLMYPPTRALKNELLECLRIRGHYSRSTGFNADSTRMMRLFSFLQPEEARLIILGVRLGITAHVVYLVAYMRSKNRFLTDGTSGRAAMGGPSPDRSGLETFCLVMGNSNWAPSYRNVGDSVAMADMLVSFFSQIENNNGVPEASFWSGSWMGEDKTASDVISLYVRDEGRDAVVRNANEICSVLSGIGLISGTGADYSGPLAPSLNRHIVDANGYYLNDQGRTILNALLASQSSRVGVRRDSIATIYDISKSTEGGPDKMVSLYSEASTTHSDGGSSSSSKAAAGSGCKTFGRYSSMFKRKEKYQGLIDPITTGQIAVFMNINSANYGLSFRPDKQTMQLDLNACTAPAGLKINLGAHYDGVHKVRELLRRALAVLIDSNDKHLAAEVTRLAVSAWTHYGLDSALLRTAP